MGVIKKEGGPSTWGIEVQLSIPLSGAKTEILKKERNRTLIQEREVSKQ